MNDLTNLRNTQQSYGYPTVGDLFRAKPEDIKETIEAVFHMLRKSIADTEFRNEARTKFVKFEAERAEQND